MFVLKQSTGNQRSKSSGIFQLWSTENMHFWGFFPSKMQLNWISSTTLGQSSQSRASPVLLPLLTQHKRSQHVQCVSRCVLLVSAWAHTEVCWLSLLVLLCGRQHHQGVAPLLKVRFSFHFLPPSVLDLVTCPGVGMETRWFFLVLAASLVPAHDVTSAWLGPAAAVVIIWILFKLRSWLHLLLFSYWD